MGRSYYLSIIDETGNNDNLVVDDEDVAHAITDEDVIAKLDESVDYYNSLAVHAYEDQKLFSFSKGFWKDNAFYARMESDDGEYLYDKYTGDGFDHAWTRVEDEEFCAALEAEDQMWSNIEGDNSWSWEGGVQGEVFKTEVFLPSGCQGDSDDIYVCFEY
jgi:hypothetical protein